MTGIVDYLLERLYEKNDDVRKFSDWLKGMEQIMNAGANAACSREDRVVSEMNAHFRKLTAAITESEGIR